MIVHVQLDAADRALPLTEFEALVREGRIGALTPVRIDAVTGGAWVAAGTLELWHSLANSPEAQFARAWSRPAIPWVTALLCGACVRIFAWGWGTRPGQLLWDQGARVSAEVIERGQSYRLLTYGLLHANLEHITNNLLFLAYTGIALETVVGAPAVAALFVVSVVSGGALSTWMSPEQTSVGASAGDFGFLVTAIVFGWRYLDLVPARAQARFGGAIVLFAVMGFINGLFATRTDNWGHLGGVLAGLLVGALLRPGGDTPGRLHNRRVAIGLLVATAIGMAAVALAGPRLLPWAPWEEDGLHLRRPAYWSVGWTGNQDRGWSSPTGGAAVSARTFRREHYTTLDAASRELVASFTTLDDAATASDGQPVQRGGVEGRHFRVSWTTDNQERESDVEVYTRGRYVQTVVVDHLAGDDTLGAVLNDRVFGSLEIGEPEAVTAALASAGPDTLRGQLILARTATDLGNVTRAVELYRGALVAAPSSTGVWEQWLADLPDLAPDSVVAEAEAGIRAAPDNRRIRVAAANVMAQAGQPARAVAILQEGLATAPGDTTLSRALRKLEK